MPTYRFIGEFVTLVMRVRVRTWQRIARPQDHSSPQAREVADLLQRFGRRRQFATHWMEEDLTSGATTPGLNLSDAYMARGASGRLVACAALWDQRATKQMVVCGYAPHLARMRRILNAVARLIRQPLLPAMGQPIRAAYLSHLAIDDRAPEQSLMNLVDAVHSTAAARGVDYLIAGLPRNEPLLASIKHRFGGRELLSRLYAVYWPDGRDAVRELDDRPVWPEVALL
jgi:hypothetical protein